MMIIIRWERVGRENENDWKRGEKKEIKYDENKINIYFLL
jgi:hypothetical protein